MAKMFTYRDHKPTKGDRYISFYNNSKNGGQSRCVNGKPTDAEANVLGNCVGYSCGRFNEAVAEMTNSSTMKYKNFCTDAERFIEVAKNYGLKYGDIPMRGAIMCWQKGATLSHGDGAGHVAFVEKVINSKSVEVSESGWDSYIYRNKIRNYGVGKWGCGALYTLRGFIYNPILYTNPYPIPTRTIKKTTPTMKGDDVKWMQYQLNLCGYGLTIDGSAGAKTIEALKNFQQSVGLKNDGKCGRDTKTALININM